MVIRLSTMTQAGATACGMCGVAIDPTRAHYSNQGVLICDGCNLHEDVQVQEGRAISSLQKAGYGALGLGVVSLFVCNPVMMLSIATIVTAIGTMTTLARHPEYKAKLGAHYVGLWVACLFALAMGALPFVALAGFIGLSLGS